MADARSRPRPAVASVLIESADPAATLTVDRVVYRRAGNGSRPAGADAAASRLR